MNDDLKKKLGQTLTQAANQRQMMAQTVAESPGQLRRDLSENIEPVRRALANRLQFTSRGNDEATVKSLQSMNESLLNSLSKAEKMGAEFLDKANTALERSSVEKHDSLLELSQKVVDLVADFSMECERSSRQTSGEIVTLSRGHDTAGVDATIKQFQDAARLRDQELEEQYRTQLSSVAEFMDISSAVNNQVQRQEHDVEQNSVMENYQENEAPKHLSATFSERDYTLTSGERRVVQVAEATLRHNEDLENIRNNDALKKQDAAQRRQVGMPGFDATHLLAAMFGALPDLRNLVNFNTVMNRTEIQKWERETEKRRQSGADLKVRVEAVFKVDAEDKKESAPISIVATRQDLRTGQVDALHFGNFESELLRVLQNAAAEKKILEKDILKEARASDYRQRRDNISAEQQRRERNKDASQDATALRAIEGGLSLAQKQKEEEEAITEQERSMIAAAEGAKRNKDDKENRT